MKNLITIVVLLMFFACSENLKENKNDAADKSNTTKNLNSQYRKTGWISDTTYRALVHIVTIEECKSTPEEDLRQKVRNEAVISLQRSFSDGFNRKRHSALLNLVNNYGRIIVDSQECVKDKVYVLDIVKENLKNEMQRIKNIK